MFFFSSFLLGNPPLQDHLDAAFCLCISTCVESSAASFGSNSDAVPLLSSCSSNPPPPSPLFSQGLFGIFDFFLFFYLLPQVFCRFIPLVPLVFREPGPCKKFHVSLGRIFPVSTFFRARSTPQVTMLRRLCACHGLVYFDWIERLAPTSPECV